MVERFNRQGLAALLIAPGRGRKETSTLEQRERIVEEFRRVPDRKADATATWSLMTLRRALRKQALPRVGASTIREVLTRGQATAVARHARGVRPARPCGDAKPDQ